MQFTEYEAKAYIALLEKSPLTGYAIARNSNVPQSKIYEVLNNLLVRGDIFVNSEDTQLYTPLLPSELLKQRKRSSDEIYTLAEAELKKYTEQNWDENIWTLSGHKIIINKFREVISRAKKRLRLLIWTEDFYELEDEIKAASDSGIKIDLITFGEPIEIDFTFVHLHVPKEDLYNYYEARIILCSTDNHEAISGILTQDDKSIAIWTTNHGLWITITECIISFLYNYEIISVLRPEIEKHFGPNMINLFRKYYS